MGFSKEPSEIDNLFFAGDLDTNMTNGRCNSATPAYTMTPELMARSNLPVLCQETCNESSTKYHAVHDISPERPIDYAVIA